MSSNLFDDRIVQKRSIPKVEMPVEPRVTAGSIDKVIDLAFNPTRDKIREVTIIDRMQGRLLPQLDMLSSLMDYVMEVAEYRESPEAYMVKYERAVPISPELVKEYMYRLAQWQKSVSGRNLERATDIALAETESQKEREESGRTGENPFNQ